MGLGHIISPLMGLALSLSSLSLHGKELLGLVEDVFTLFESFGWGGEFQVEPLASRIHIPCNTLGIAWCATPKI